MGKSYVGGRRRTSSHQQQSRKSPYCDGTWLLNVSLTALAAGAIIAFGHWFHAKQGRCVGSSKSKKHNGDDGTRTCRPNNSKPASLSELRQQRLKAAEARLGRGKNEPSAIRLTPLGMILELARKVDLLEAEAKSLIESASSVLNPSEEKEQVRLLELLALVQLEVDAVQADESVRPHRKVQTIRIQNLIADLDKLKSLESCHTD